MLTRRYQKLAEGEGVLDLVLIDGGLGQVGIALEVMAEVGLSSLPIVGVARGEAQARPGDPDYSATKDVTIAD